MPTYVDLLKLFEMSTGQSTTLVLPHPLEEIFPDKVASDRLTGATAQVLNPLQQSDLLKKHYEDLVTHTFEGRA